MTLKAKICGVSTPEAVQAALEGGAGWLGFVFFPKSPRNLSLEAAGRLAEPVRQRAKVVALLVDPADAQVDEVAQGLRPDLIQLHGHESPSRTREIAARAGCGIIKALPVADASDLAAAAAYESVVEHLMFDAKPPKDGRGSWPAAWIPGTWPRRPRPPGRPWWTFPLAWSEVRA